MGEPKDAVDAYAMYLVVNESLGMSPGKIAAQVGHAVMELVEKKASVDLWLSGMTPGLTESYNQYLNKANSYNTWRANCRKVVLRANPAQWRKLRPMADALVIDSGYTEIAPNSETVLGFWPMKKSEAPVEIQKLQVL